MNNKGRITVFLCMLISAMLLIGITAINVINIFAAKEKTAIAARSSVSGIKADYNSYIFEHYHILLFDKNCDGKGEAMLEEKMMSDLEYNLGDGFVVNDVAVTDYTMLQENDCQALKEQIRDYMKYAAVEYGVDTILESTDGKDGTIEPEVLEDMDNATEGGDMTMDEGDDSAVSEENEESENQTSDRNEEPDSASDDNSGNSLFVEDPRDFTEDMSDSVLLSIVVPEDVKVSGEVVDLSEVPSLREFSLLSEIYKANDSFDDYDDLKTDLKMHDSWKDKLIDAGAGVTYARNVFNCATNQEVNSDAVFGCEIEYLIAGRDSDKENLETVVRRLLLVRLPVNYSYLISDAAKMSQIRAISVPLSFIVVIPEPILTYLIAGCWSYVEAMADVHGLLEGKRIPFVKDSTSWITDLNDLENSVSDECTEDERGLCYEDYLMILMALNMDKVYYRMLDIMELNVRQQQSQFQIENAAVHISVDFDVSYDGRTFCIHEAGGY